MVAVLEIKIFYEKSLIMIYIGIGFIVTAIWIAFEIWRAPIMEETDSGKLITKRPTKKISDLFKKKQKSGTFSYLEKYKRGKSKY